MNNNTKHLLVVLLLTLSACVNTNGKSQIRGYVTSIHQQGWLCKTWEMQIQRGGLQNTGGTIGAAFNITVPDSLVGIVTEKFNRNEEAVVTYRSEITGLTSCKTESGGDYLEAIK